MFKGPVLGANTGRCREISGGLPIANDNRSPPVSCISKKAGPEARPKVRSDECQNLPEGTADQAATDAA